MDHLEQVAHQPVYYRRVAIRPNEGADWQWYGSPVAFTPTHAVTATAVLEDQCRQAATLYPAERICTVQAPSKEAFDRLNMADLGK